MIVKAKFRVYSVTDFGGQKAIVAQPVTSGSEENKAFWQATPTGKLEMTITNPAAADLFKPGQEIVIDFHMPEPVTA